MTLEWPADIVIYRSRLNAKINRNFEVFSATNFLAASPSISPTRARRWSATTAGPRQDAGPPPRGLPPDLVPRRPGVSPPPPVKLPSKRWRDLILRVWHVDPLRCPICQSPMRVIAVIDDPRVTERILRHLGAWHNPPARLPAPGAPGP